MTEAQIIDVMAKAIYDAENGIDGDQIADMLHDDFRINADTVDAQLEQVRNVCRQGAAAALAALNASGLAIVPVEEATRLLGIVADGASDQMYADPDDTEMLDAFNRLSAMIGKV